MNTLKLQALHCADAAINFQFSAGHQLAFITGKIEHRIGDIIWLANFTERDLTAEFGKAFFFTEHLLHAVQNGRIDKDRMDGVTANLPPVLAQCKAIDFDMWRTAAFAVL
jgi:hypothetical protein